MAKIIDMQSMRQINLFTKVSRVQTKHFFIYNNTLIFGVPKNKVSQAIGKNAANVKRLSQILRRKIKVVVMPKDNPTKEEIGKFVGDLINPVKVGKIEVFDDKVEINANRINKAALIGRNRAREKELMDILKDAFNIRELKIV